jgi:hypothetical protein
MYNIRRNYAGLKLNVLLGVENQNVIQGQVRVMVVVIPILRPHHVAVFGTRLIANKKPVFPGMSVSSTMVVSGKYQDYES